MATTLLRNNMFTRSFLLVFVFVSSGAAGQTQLFERVSDHPLSQTAAQSNAALWGDVEGDGDLDLYVSNTRRPDELWLNEGEGEYRLVSFGVQVRGTRTSGVWADLDNDGDLDLALSTFSGLVVLQNNGGTWGIANTGSGSSRDVNAADVDGDGVLDLFSSVRQDRPNELYLGGPSGFQRHQVGTFASDADDSVSSSWGDVDGDGDLDLYVANTTFQENRLYINEQGVLSSSPESPSVSERAYSTGSSWGDIDGDGDFDLLVLNQRSEGNRLFLNKGGRLLEAEADVFQTRFSEAKSSAFGDVDNDGDLDLVIATKDAVDDLYINRGDGTFKVLDLGEASDGWAVGATLVDTDEDGDLDLFVSHGANNRSELNVYHRNSTSGGENANWLAVDLIGTVSNRNAIGARIDVYARIAGRSVQITRAVESRSGRTAQSGFRLHVGMGDAAAADSMVIRWPTGARQRLEGLAANQRVTVVETAVTSGEAPLALRSFSVGPPFPNPASGVVRIPIDMHRAGIVTVDVFDARGRRVWSQMVSAESGDRPRVEWPSHRTAFAAGAYSIRVRSREDTVVQTVTLVR